MTLALWDLARDQAGVIDGFDDALPPAYRTRLMELGFHPGERVSCLQSPALGAPRVYLIANTTFSLDDEIARHLRIRLDDGS